MRTRGKGLALMMLRALCALVAVTLISTSGATAAETESGVKPTPPATTYWHLWTDGRGVSHLTSCKLSAFTLESMAPPADAEWVNRQPSGNATVITVVQPPHWKGIWHKETSALWVVTLKGKWFIEAMDGTKLDLGPGDVWLAEDKETKQDAAGRQGHQSGNLGDDPVTLLVVQLDEEPAVDQPCRFK